nr:hypothetical protein [Tanacetum cinerariifolium]
MFSLYELYGMLNDLGLGDNNQITFTRFRIPGMSLDDGLVLLMADVDVIKLLNYVAGCKEISVYRETGMSLVELHFVESLVPGMGNEEAVSRSVKESRLLMLEWLDIGKEDEHVDTSNHASTSNACSIVKPRNDENVGYLDRNNEVPMGNPFSFINLLEGPDIEIHNVANEHDNETLMDDDLFQQDSVVDFQHDHYHVIDKEQEIAEMVAELNHPREEVIFQTSGAQVDPS